MRVILFVEFFVILFPCLVACTSERNLDLPLRSSRRLPNLSLNLKANFLRNEISFVPPMSTSQSTQSGQTNLKSIGSQVVSVVGMFVLGVSMTLP